MSRFFWNTLPYLLALEIFSLLPVRVPSVKNTQPHFATGVVHLPLRPGNIQRKLDHLSQAANKAGLDFVVLTNLDKVFPSGTAGVRNGVDIYTEIETSTPAGHGIYFYSHTDAAELNEKKLREQAWQHFLGKNSHRGAFFVVSHPSSFFIPWERLDRFPDGIELINLRALVERFAFDSPLSFALTALLSPFNPYLATLRAYDPVSRDFKGFDAVNTVAPGHFGLTATDDLSDWPLLEHAGIPIPPWEQTLKSATNVVFPEAALSEDFGTRRRQIYSAIRDGRSALLLQAIHPFSGNDWYLECGKSSYRSGDKFALREAGCEFVIKLPPTLSGTRKIVLIRDGEVELEIPRARDEEHIPVTQDGAYRLEVWVRRSTLFHVLLDKEIPYLFYNPLYVR